MDRTITERTTLTTATEEQDIGVVDLYLAAYLQDNGCDVVAVEPALGAFCRNGDTKIAFKFKQTTDLKKKLMDYPSTDAHKFVNVIYALKRMLKTHSSKN